MNIDIELWVIIGILFLLFVFGLSFLISTGGKKRKKKRISGEMKSKEQKDWKKASLRLEKHINILREENIGWQKNVKVLERETEIHKDKVGVLKEKLDRERKWQKKEAQSVDRKGERVKQLEEALEKIEHQLESEHSEVIILRRENIEAKDEVESKAERIKALELEIQKIKAQSDVYRDDILNLRSENRKLSKKHEDVQWIAKSVHMKVKEELRHKVQECEHLRKELIKKQ